MRVESLSNYAGQLLQSADEQLRAAQSDAHNLHIGHDQALSAVRSARRAKPFWKRLLGVRTPEERAAIDQARWTWQQQYFAQARVYQSQVSVAQRATGVAGEDVMTMGLANLPDEWVLLRGYRNRGGEIDHLLVGPLGIWAVEVKRRAVRVHVTGDQWRYEKLDRRGNVVDVGWATDNGGRSWARQVNEPAEKLRRWLAKNGHRVPIHTAVMLMHERAQIGRLEHLTVNLLGTHPQQLVETIWRQPSPLSPTDCAAILKLIRRDHRYHNQQHQR